VRNDNLGIPLLTSLGIHVLVILLGAVVFHNDSLRPKDFLPIHLVDLPRPEIPPPHRKFEAPPEIRKPLPPSPKAEKPVEKPPAAKPAIVKAEPPPPLPPAQAKEEPSKVAEAKPTAPATTESAPSFASSSRVEGGGSEAGAGNLFGKGDAGVVPGSGSAGGGGGTAASGLGRGSGAPALPAPPAVLRTNRAAKPVQTVRAAYPPMALRLGLEGDVALRIEVDAEGKVTKAQVTRSGGPGFDEEALKAVRQSRFEPAQKDGKNVSAEFTYIYRFRLQR
jgi:protein TonB